MSLSRCLFNLTLSLCLAGKALAAPLIDAPEKSEDVKKLLQADHAIWQSLPETSITMLPQNITKPMLTTAIFQKLLVKAVVSRGWLCLRMEWEDKTRDAEVTKGLFTDACAVEFALSGNGKDTSPFMGNPGKPVEIIHWKAIWQDDIEQGYRDVEHGYPNYYYDYYTLAKGKKANEITGPALQYNPGRYLNNPISQTQRQEPVEEIVAEGFGTATSQKHLDSKAWGVYKNNRWTVVIARPLTTPDPTDAQFKPGSTIPVAFALWDGASKNRGARKHYAMWTDLKLGGTAK